MGPGIASSQCIQSVCVIQSSHKLLACSLTALQAQLGSSVAITTSRLPGSFLPIDRLKGRDNYCAWATDMGLPTTGGIVTPFKNRQMGHCAPSKEDYASSGKNHISR